MPAPTEPHTIHPSSKADIDRAVARLRAGLLVAFPTETVYGLGADALNPAAVRRVFDLKGRPAHNPLIVHVHDLDAAQSLTTHWPPHAHTLARALWPGPLTLVLPAAPHIPSDVTARGSTIALRIPAHPLALQLLRAFAGPLVGPSANPSGRVSPTTADHVRDAFHADDVLVLDGGPCTVGLESTVLDLTTDPPQILRPGAIDPQHLAHLLGHPIHAASHASHASGPLRSPGLLGRHYAPLVPARLLILAELIAAARQLAERREPFAALVRSLDAQRDLRAIAARVGDHTTPPTLIDMPADARAYAARLYAALRQAETPGPSGQRPAAILIERPPSDPPLWPAVLDRLRRATTP